MNRTAVAALAGLSAAAAVYAMRVPSVRAQAPQRAAYVAYYWRARPDQVAAYGDYIRKVAEPIDADAQRAGAFIDVRTVTPAEGTSADWTHLRIFRVKDAAAAQARGDALDRATARVVPDDATRKANSARAAGLRDFVRQEIWTDLP